MAKKIVVCDDDQDILDMISMLLVIHGYDVLCENNSNLVCQLVEKEKPDAVLIDLWMPSIPGDQVTRQLKSNQATRNIPVILFSASHEGKARAELAGADDYISKPFDVEVLLKTVMKQ